MMVSAFTDHDFMMDAYQEAIKEKYRFYSYGDAMLII
jgi:S-adenosylmethionine:tRNA ribosyltransferase-isomerase